MKYSTDYKIKDITVLSTVNNFQNFISKIEVICKIDIKELNEIIELPMSSLLPISQDDSNYIPFENITKKNLIEWVLVDNQHKIDIIMNRLLQDKDKKRKEQQSVSNKQQKITVKTFTENDLGKFEFINEKSFSEISSE